MSLPPAGEQYREANRFADRDAAAGGVAGLLAGRQQVHSRRGRGWPWRHRGRSGAAGGPDSGPAGGGTGGTGGGAGTTAAAGAPFAAGGGAGITYGPASLAAARLAAIPEPARSVRAKLKRQPSAPLAGGAMRVGSACRARRAVLRPAPRANMMQAIASETGRAMSQTLLNDPTTAVRKLAQRIEPELIEIRRDIHAHPGTAFEEVRTAGVVAAELTRLGIPHQTEVGKTGVVGLIHGGRPGPVLAIRADMDALPIQEATGLPFASTNPGLMHACGHDIHTTTLLGVAALLKDLAPQLAGTVKLVFQPAEEAIGGMRAMIADGVMDGPKIDMALGFHNHPDMPVGTLRLCPRRRPGVGRQLRYRGARQVRPCGVPSYGDRPDHRRRPSGDPVPNGRVAGGAADDVGCGHRRRHPRRHRPQHHPR